MLLPDDLVDGAKEPTTYYIPRPPSPDRTSGIRQANHHQPRKDHDMTTTAEAPTQTATQYPRPWGSLICDLLEANPEYYDLQAALHDLAERADDAGIPTPDA